MSRFTLMELPFDKKQLEPYISEETINFHYNKHHNTYVNNLNNLLETEAAAEKYKDLDLEEIIIKSKEIKDKPVFNNAAQVYNHDFFWKSINPSFESKPFNAGLIEKINNDFNSIDEMKSKLLASALSNFGSGWTWLVLDKKQNKILIKNTSNAENFLHDSSITHLLTIDVWEHSYYVDYRNNRKKYLESFINKLMNFDFILQNYVKTL